MKSTPIVLVTGLFTAIVFVVFAVIAFSEVEYVRGEIARIMKLDVKALGEFCGFDSSIAKVLRPCKLPYSTFSENLLSTVGATLATLVSGYLGIARVNFGTGTSVPPVLPVAPAARLNLFDALNQTAKNAGGGSVPVGWLLAVGTLLFVGSLLYSTYGSYVIGQSLLSFKTAQIILPPILGQMSATGIGLLLGGVGVFVGSHIK